MRELFTVLSIVLLSTILSAQKFVATPNGLRNSVETDKSFVVIDIEGQSASELYEKTIRYVAQNYKNPNEVKRGLIENEYMRINTYSSDVIYFNVRRLTVLFDAEYTIELYFKDGKIKYEVIDSKITASGYEHQIQDMIYNKKGVLKQEDLKLQIENYFNSGVERLTRYLTSDLDENNKW